LTDLLADYAIFGSDVSGGLSFQINATTGFLQLQTNTGTVIATATSGAISAGSPFLVSAYYVPSGANPRWFFWINGQNVGFGTPTITAAIGNALLGQAGPTSSKFFKGLIGAKTLAQFMPSNPQYSLENGLVSKWGPMGAFTRIHTTVAQDNFVDTDGVNLASHAMITGLGWTNTVGTYFIQSNSAQDNTLSGGIAHATFIPTTLISDATYTLAVTPAAVASAVGMLFRFSNASNYWMAEVVAGSNIAIINKVVAGVSTRMSTVSMTITAGIPYTLVVTYYGDTITFSVNGNAPASVLDIFNMNATGVGIRVSQSNPTPRSALDSLLLTT
jgi:hypothetical protein